MSTPTQNVPPPRVKRKRSLLLRFLGFAFTAGVLLFLVGSGVAAYMLWEISKDLPDYDKLATYEPAVMTRVHANDGSLIGEFAREKRIYLPINAIPQRVINAFVAAEDQNFYKHNGIDAQGVARALFKMVKKELAGGSGRSEGASTITQQVAKNFLLSNERTMMRKVKEGILAVRIEGAYSKDKILELYLNEIFFGMGSYGVAAASLNYFGKELKDLTVEECAYLASLPKGPNNYHPLEKTQKAIERRNWVIGRMRDDGYVSAKEAEDAQKKPLGYNPRRFGATQFAAEYFSEEVRRTLVDIYGEDKLYGGGLSVHATLDPEMQKLARRAMREGLLRFDRKKGYRGAVKKISASGDWGAELSKIPVLADLAPWRLGVVLEATKERAVVGLQPEMTATGKPSTARNTVELSWDNVRWATKLAEGVPGRSKKPMGVNEVLAVGDAIYVAPADEAATKDDDEDEKPTKPVAAANPNAWRLVQIPLISGAMVVMDPHTGRVLAIVGGFSYAESQFDRAVQAKRQPGSTFKPIVYAAALDNGYTPSSIVLDAPFEIEQGPNQAAWRPDNYENKFYGPSTIRLGLEKSRNLMTVRLAQDLGMPVVAEYSRRFGVHDNMLPVLSMALGAGETTVLRMTTAYCSFANGGKKVNATLIDRIQDRYGKTIYRRDNAECAGCNADAWSGQDEPELKDSRQQIIDPLTAYQMVSLMEGVVKRGTGYKVSKVGKPLAGKTGTSNDAKDAWFVGFSPDLVAGVFIGYDNPTPMGKGETGGGTAAPIFRDFMRWALADKPATPFRMPPQIKLVRIDAKTGMRAQAGTEKTILEAYKPNEDPPDPLSYVTYPGVDVEGQTQGQTQGQAQDPASADDPDQPVSAAPSGGGYVRRPEAGGLY